MPMDDGALPELPVRVLFACSGQTGHSGHSGHSGQNGRISSGISSSPWGSCAPLVSFRVQHPAPFPVPSGMLWGSSTPPPQGQGSRGPLQLRPPHNQLSRKKNTKWWKEESLGSLPHFQEEDPRRRTQASVVTRIHRRPPTEIRQFRCVISLLWLDGLPKARKQVLASPLTRLRWASELQAVHLVHVLIPHRLAAHGLKDQGAAQIAPSGLEIEDS
jgi:hypothetical protein